MDVLSAILWLSVIFASFHSHAARSSMKHNKRFRPVYHLTAPEGWMTNPAGITFFRGHYHLFYQFHPYNGQWGYMNWGHAISKNLIDWTHYPPALAPSENYDRHGCLAGSAVVHNNFLTLFYTGHSVTRGEALQTQNMAISGDGMNFKKYISNPIISRSPTQANMKNPKVWRYRNTWYMVLATTSKEGNGELLLYTSSDMFSWALNGTLVSSYGDMGYIWENPDMFPLKKLHVLVFSAQGIEIEVDQYRFNNVYQTGYIVGKFNYLSCQFDDLELSVATFHPLDYGHDFFAPRTFLSDGRRVLIAWMGMWDNDFVETSLGWAGMTTLPRELRFNEMGRILMNPIKELEDLRMELLDKAWYSPGETFRAGSRSFELLVNSTTTFTDVALKLEWKLGSIGIAYSSDHSYVSVTRGIGDDERRAYWTPEDHIYFRIFVDFSSIEIFCGEGDVVFTSRIYPKAITVRIKGDSNLHIELYRLRNSIGFDTKKRRKKEKY